MFLLYIALGAVWGWLCYRHQHDLLPIQVRLSQVFVSSCR